MEKDITPNSLKSVFKFYSLTDYNLDAFLNGGEFKYKSGGTDSAGNYGYTYSGFIKAYKNRKFKETLGEYKYNQYNSTEDKGTESTSSLLKNRKKLCILF